MDYELIEIRDKYVNYLSKKNDNFAGKYQIFKLFNELIEIKNDLKYYLNEIEKIWIKEINLGNIDYVLEEIMKYFYENENINDYINYEKIISCINDDNLIYYFEAIKNINHIDEIYDDSIKYLEKSNLLDSLFLIKINESFRECFIILNKIPKNRIFFKKVVMNKLTDNIKSSSICDLNVFQKYFLKKVMNYENKCYYLKEYYYLISEKYKFKYNLYLKKSYYFTKYKIWDILKDNKLSFKIYLNNVFKDKHKYYTFHEEIYHNKYFIYLILEKK